MPWLAREHSQSWEHLHKKLTIFKSFQLQPLFLLIYLVNVHVYKYPLKWQHLTNIWYREDQTDGSHRLHLVEVASTQPRQFEKQTQRMTSVLWLSSLHYLLVVSYGQLRSDDPPSFRGHSFMKNYQDWVEPSRFKLGRSELCWDRTMEKPLYCSPTMERLLKPMRLLSALPGEHWVPSTQLTVTSAQHRQKPMENAEAEVVWVFGFIRTADIETPLQTVSVPNSARSV